MTSTNVPRRAKASFSSLWFIKSTVQLLNFNITPHFDDKLNCPHLHKNIISITRNNATFSQSESLSPEWEQRFWTMNTYRLDGWRINEALTKLYLTKKNKWVKGTPKMFAHDQLPCNFIHSADYHSAYLTFHGSMIFPSGCYMKQPWGSN